MVKKLKYKYEYKICMKNSDLLAMIALENLNNSFVDSLGSIVFLTKIDTGGVTLSKSEEIQCNARGGYVPKDLRQQPPCPNIQPKGYYQGRIYPIKQP